MKPIVVPDPYAEHSFRFGPQIAEALLAAEARVAELEMHLQTEREMHNAWRKRAEEAEAKPAGILGLVPGMRPVNPADLAEYEREMQQAIEEMVLEQKRKWWGKVT